MGANDIAADIASRIVRGEWVKGDKLPTTAEFAERYQVHATTIYDAMRELRILGIVRGVRGGRRYVA